jgi:hypothetical protein
MSASIGTIRFAVGAFLALAWQAAIAYETPVHSEITRNASSFFRVDSASAAVSKNAPM